jgi:peptidoglycan/xylan/chitin deacetylase (PgdA/CDA1 family)
LIHRIAHRIQGARLTAIYGLGKEKNLYQWPERRDMVLCYHSILPHENTALHVRNHGINAFRQHISYLKKHHTFVSLQELTEVPSASRRLALTFDDGLINNLRYALPILEEEKIPATFFISTSYLQGRSVLWPDLLSQWSKNTLQLVFENTAYLRSSHGTFRSKEGVRLTDVLMKQSPEVLFSWLDANTAVCGEPLTEWEDEWRVMKAAELQLLAQSSLVDIGSHGISHIAFTELSADELRFELEESKTYLEQTLHRPVTSIAFPFGLYSQTVIHHCLAAGYKQLVGVEKGEVHHSSLVFRKSLDNLRSTLHTIDAVHKAMEQPFTFHP